MRSRLFWHVARRFALTFAAVLGILCALVTTLKLVEASRGLLQHESPLLLAASLALCIAMDLCHRLFFVALLLAAVLCTNRMARQGELLGLAAQGISPKRLAQPFMAVAIACTLVVMFCGDRVLPWAMAQRTALLSQRLGKVEPATLYFQKRSAWYCEGDSIYYLPDVLLDHTGFARPAIYTFRQNSLHELLRGESLTYSAPGGGWVLNNAVSYRLDTPTIGRDAHLPMPLRIAPTALMEHMGNPRELSHRAARALIARRQSSGLDTTVHSIETLERMMQPLCAPCLLAAALPWLLAQDRKRSLALALCKAVAWVAVILTAGQILRLMSLAHDVPVVLGASGQLVGGAVFCAGVYGPILLRRHTSYCTLQATTRARTHML